MEKTHMKSAYLLFKDHQRSFENSQQSRLINPSKTELDLISKNLSKRIIDATRETSYNNLRKDSSDTIKRFHNIKNKNKATFIQFDMIDFYSFPRISYYKV